MGWGIRSGDYVGFQGGLFDISHCIMYWHHRNLYQIRKASVQALSNLITSRDVVENILLAKKYRVKQWLWDGYLKLIQQTNPVEINELHSSNVDLLTIARICSVREKTVQVNCKCCHRGCDRRTSPRVNIEIAQVFAGELKEMEDFEDILPKIPSDNVIVHFKW